jgi:hypothetical protein
MKNVHILTLPEEQAKWFHEICLDLGIKATLIGNDKVSTVCEHADREIAWDLFKEKFNLTMTLPA